MASESNHSPAPLVSNHKDLADQDTPELKKTLANAKEGASSKTDATKTPQKIQEGDTSEKKREY